MYFYVLQLFDIDYKDDIILAMTSSGIKEATVIDGTNLDHMLRKDFPIFAGLLPGKSERERFSMLIFGMVDRRETAIGFLEVLAQAGIQNKNKEIFKLMIVQGEDLA